MRALQRVSPAYDVVRASEVGLVHTPDPEILDWALREGRVVLSHDVRTMRPLAEARLAAGQPISGLILTRSETDVGEALRRLVRLFESGEREYLGLVVFI